MDPATLRRIDRFLLLDPAGYRRMAGPVRSVIVGLVTVIGVYFVVGTRAFVGAGAGEVFELPRFIALGVARGVIIALILWLIGSQFYERRTSPLSVLGGVWLAHVPLLFQALVPNLFGIVVGFVWFVAAMGAAAEANLALDRRRGATAASLSFLGLIIVMGTFPVDLTGLPALPAA